MGGERTASGRPRLVDVAARAGVSTATASLVLRGRPGPSLVTADAVRAAAGTLGYRPDRTASLLARRRSRLLGVLFDVTSPFHAELVMALDDEAARVGLDLVLASVTRRTSEAEAIHNLLDFRCEAVVLIGPTMAGAQIDELASSVPTVVVGARGTARAAGVRVSDAQALELAVDHLVDLGHRRIAYVDGPRGWMGTSRRSGYRAAMLRHRLGDCVDVLPGGATENDGMGAAELVLSRDSQGRPTAVICFNDRCAIGLRDVVVRQGVAVPGDLSVVGFDDSPLARLGTQDLTSVSQEPDALARAAVTALTAISESGAQMAVRAATSAPNSDVVIAPRLVVRSSTAPPKPGP